MSLTEVGKGLVVHLLNATGHISKPLTEMIPVHDIELKIRTTGTKARSLVSKEELKSSREGGYLALSIPRLETYDVLVIS